MLTVYGPQEFSDKLQFLANMKTAYQAFPQDTPVFLGGDFNLIAQASDKSNNNINRRGKAAFRGFINELQLKDLYLQGRRYTWSNDQARATMVKLDRILFNDSWDAAFPGSLLQALSSEISDHCPLLLTCDAPFRPARQFRFENYWVKMEKFELVVQHAWHQPVTTSDPLARIHQKLQRTAKELKAWSSEFSNNITLKGAIISEIIARLDAAMDKRELTPEERSFRAALKMQRLGLAALERSIWRQRSRVQEIKEGHASLRFFISKASARRRKKHIHRVVHNDQILTDQADKIGAMEEFFEQLIGTKVQRTQYLDLAALGIHATDLTGLETPFTSEEVQAALNEMNSNKAPGLDGFTVLFYKQCWEIIRDDVMAALHALHNLQDQKLHLLNRATMVLIPKNEQAESPREFRPISLIDSFAKLFTKILALRLRGKMQELVQPYQNAFIRGRTIHDNYVYVSGIAKALRQSKTPALMIKLDIEKAFDTVSWEFILQILEAKDSARK